MYGDNDEKAWQTVKGQIQRRWGRLTDEDLNKIKRNRQEFILRLQKRYGLSKDVAERDIAKWATTSSERHWLAFTD